MIANIQFENIEEMQEFAKLISGGCSCKEKAINISAPAVESSKEEPKETNKAKTSKKADKAKDKKEQPKEVEAEVTGVDENANNEPIQDAEPNEEDKKEDEGAKVTKEMVREICSRAIKAGKPGEVKKIVADHGASKIPELKEEEFAAVYKEVEALL
ncbi:MAG: hypothetical protein ACLSTJ_07900 [Clostridium neonatale]